MTENGESATCPVCQNGGGRAFGSWANCPHGWAGWRAAVEHDIEEGRARYEAQYGPLNICSTCKTVVAPGTRHGPFNGNQMFACEVIPLYGEFIDAANGSSEDQS